MVLNGIWQVGHGFQLSGIHYTSAGDRSANSYGGDLRMLGAGSDDAAAQQHALDLLAAAAGEPLLNMKSAALPDDAKCYPDPIPGPPAHAFRTAAASPDL